MKLALVTTPADARSGIGDYTSALAAELGQLCALEVFVEPGREGGAYLGRTTRSAAKLAPREFDQVLYQLGNERQHGFMARMVRALGGCVALHDWVLFDMALAAYPALARGGWKGHALALREGGVEQALVYARNRRDRRRARPRAQLVDPRTFLDAGPGLVAGWWESEARGRWTSDVALLRLDGERCSKLRLDVVLEAPRALRLLLDGRELARCDRSCVLQVGLGGARSPLVELQVSGVSVPAAQRRAGDQRRLGAFVRALDYDSERGVKALDLRGTCAHPARGVELARERFELALNHSVVRFGDAFIVHSEHLRSRILDERNAPTPIGVVQHGAQCASDQRAASVTERRAERAALGLPSRFHGAFLITSFGGVQRHKRIDVLLQALALARAQRDDVHLALIGGLERGDCDAPALAERHGVREAVHFTDHVPQELARRFIHAGDLAVQLRGPSSGGTSGGVFQSLALGRAVLASDLAEQRELPAACVLRVAHGPDEARELARQLVELRDDPQRRAVLEGAARDFVERECRWPLAAAKYLRHLESFPPPRSGKRRLIIARILEGLRQ